MFDVRWLCLDQQQNAECGVESDSNTVVQRWLRQWMDGWLDDCLYVPTLWPSIGFILFYNNCFIILDFALVPHKRICRICKCTIELYVILARETDLASKHDSTPPTDSAQWDGSLTRLRWQGRDGRIFGLRPHSWQTIWSCAEEVPFPGSGVSHTYSSTVVDVQFVAVATGSYCSKTWRRWRRGRPGNILQY
jgi:hypothetical protein